MGSGVVKYGTPESRQAYPCLGRSHVGLVRTENEDSFGVSTDRGIVAVADGMGGHANGRYVADCAVAALCQVPSAPSLDDTLSKAREALAATNRDVFSRARRSGCTMGATLVAALIGQSRVGIIWAGDSRAYIFRDGVLYGLTRDHSAVQELLEAGRITHQEAAKHPLRHVVTRALGMNSQFEVEWGTHALGLGDIILLSTDGLHGAVSEKLIEECLARYGLDALDKLIDLALDAGGRDNVTIVLLKI